MNVGGEDTVVTYEGEVDMTSSSLYYVVASTTEGERHQLGAVHTGGIGIVVVVVEQCVALVHQPGHLRCLGCY